MEKVLSTTVLYRISYDCKSALTVKKFEILLSRENVQRLKFVLFCQISIFGGKQLCFGFKSKRYYG